MTIPAFESELQFVATYQYVSDPVCLISPQTGALVAANPVFRQVWEKADNPAFDIPAIGQSLLKQGEEGAIISIKAEKNSELEMQISQAMLNGQLLWLAVGKKQLAGLPENNKLPDAEADKKALLNEIYHRVKNNLNIIVSLLSLQINRISNPEMRLLLQESKSRVFTLSLLQQNLYSSPRISEIKTANFLQALANSILSSFKPKDKNIRITREIEECWLEIDILTPLGLIVHELLLNSVLHAFVGQDSGEIYIRFQQVQKDIFLLEVEDNGIGFPQEKATASSTLGFQLIGSLSKQLNARLKIDSKPLRGSLATLEFKRGGE